MGIRCHCWRFMVGKNADMKTMLFSIQFELKEKENVSAR